MFVPSGAKRHAVQPILGPQIRCEGAQNTGRSATQAQFAILEKNDAGRQVGQPEGLQCLTRARVPISVRAIRRLFWRLVLVTQPRVERILEWSTWRRWHQGIAKYWHYKRRAVP